MNLLATTSASDEINSVIWQGIAVCWWLAVGLAVASSCLLTVSRSKWPRAGLGFAGLSIMLSLVVVLFRVHVYDIDYVAVAYDGTPASGPLLPKLIMPAFPMFLSVVVVAVWYFVRQPRVRGR